MARPAHVRGTARGRRASAAPRRCSADGLLDAIPEAGFRLRLAVSPAVAGSVSIKPGTNTSASGRHRDPCSRAVAVTGSMPSATIDPIVIPASTLRDRCAVDHQPREGTAGQFGVITVGAFKRGRWRTSSPISALQQTDPALVARPECAQDNSSMAWKRTAGRGGARRQCPCPRCAHRCRHGALWYRTAPSADRTAQVLSRLRRNFTLSPEYAEPILCERRLSFGVCRRGSDVPVLWVP